MRVGDRVYVPVIGVEEAPAQVIAIKGYYVIVAGNEERRRAAAERREPVGIAFKIGMVKKVKTAKTS